MQDRTTTTTERAPNGRSKLVPQCVAMLWLFAGCGGDSDAWPSPLAGTGTQLPAAGAGGGGATAGPAAGGSGAASQPPAAPAAQTPTDASPAAAGAAAMPDPMPIPTEPAITRPQGWQAATHERGAMPDYARLFADDRVHRIDIEMSAE